VEPHGFVERAPGRCERGQVRRDAEVVEDLAYDPSVTLQEIAPAAHREIHAILRASSRESAMVPVSRIVRHLAHRWEIPLLAGPVRPGDSEIEPLEVLEGVLRDADARLILATALWLSLVGPVPILPPPWTESDRRRIAYLCELARCLGRLRGDVPRAHGPGWPARVSGIEPRTWPERIPLFASPAPEVPATFPGTRWGILETLAFSDYGEFQRRYLRCRNRVTEAA
jgi:hypothetical protein